jgi:dihydroorotate dehydrogenase (fumarate)
MSTADLHTDYLGLTLAHPIIASASTLTGDLERLVQLEEAGAAAVVLPSLYEEQIEHEAMAMHHALEYASGLSPEATGGYFPEPPAYESGPDAHLALVRLAKDALRIPVIASLNGTTAGGWTRYARLLADFGADALELNIYLIAADPELSGADVEDQYLRLVNAVRNAVDLPLAVKVGPYFSSMGHMARRLVDAGADALVLFNRFYQPDIDLDELTVTPNLVLSSPAEMRLVLRWMALLRGRVDAQLAATTGVHQATDAVKLVLAGADVVMVASALLRHGPGYVTSLRDGLQHWFDERGYTGLTQARGSLSQRSSPDPGAFERANYRRALTEYSPDLR